jgi:hypothetical protein
MADLAVGRVDVRAAGNAYFSGTDQAQGRDLRGTYQLGRQVGLYYETSSFSQTAPILAVNQIGSQLGDAPFQGAVNELDPSVRGVTFAGHDQQAGLTYSLGLNRFRTIPYVGFYAGYDFDNVTPSCSQLVGTIPGVAGKSPQPQQVVECMAGARGHAIDVGADLVTSQLVVGGSYSPSLQGGQAGSSTAYTYSAVIAYAPTKCDTFFVTASNNQAVLTSASVGQIASGVQGEFDHEGKIGFLHAPRFQPTLFVGFANVEAFSQANYVTPALSSSLPPTVLAVPYPTRTREFYAGFRFGNPSFVQTLSSGCGTGT